MTIVTRKLLVKTSSFSAKKRTYDVYILPVLIYNKNSLRQKYLKYNLKGQKIKC